MGEGGPADRAIKWGLNLPAVGMKLGARPSEEATESQSFTRGRSFMYATRSAASVQDNCKSVTKKERERETVKKGRDRVKDRPWTDREHSS